MDAALFTRIRTAAILIVPVVAAIALGGLALKIVVLLVYAGISWEMLSFSAQLSSQQRLLSFLLLLLLPLGYLEFHLIGWLAAFLLAAVLLFTLEVAAVERDKHDLNRLDSMAVLGLALGYTGLLGSALLIATDGVSSKRLLWLLLMVIAADTFAYFTGRAMGGPKLAPRISPKKTVSGALGGIAGAAAVSWIAAYLMGFTVDGPASAKLVAWGVLVAVLALFGDLVESLVKRAFGKKDSGVLLPGHGGVLDRVDALLFAAPVLFFFQGGA